MKHEGYKRLEKFGNGSRAQFMNFIKLWSGRGMMRLLLIN